MNRIEFLKELLVLTVTFNEDTEAESFGVKRETYWRIFHTWPLLRFQWACAAWIKTARFFPKPIELVELGRAWDRARVPEKLPAPSGRGELLAPAEVKALVADLSATLATLGVRHPSEAGVRHPSEAGPVPDTLPRAESAPEYEVYAGALIPRASHPEQRPCGCLYDTLAVGASGEFKLLAMCQGHYTAEHKAQAATAKYAQRPLERQEAAR